MSKRSRNVLKIDKKISCNRSTITQKKNREKTMKTYQKDYRRRRTRYIKRLGRASDALFLELPSSETHKAKHLKDKNVSEM